MYCKLLSDLGWNKQNKPPKFIGLKYVVAKEINNKGQLRGQNTTQLASRRH